jgi:hypothetical protein
MAMSKAMTESLATRIARLRGFYTSSDHFGCNCGICQAMQVISELERRLAIANDALRSIPLTRRSQPVILKALAQTRLDGKENGE